MSDHEPAGDPGPTRHRSRSGEPTPMAGEVRRLRAEARRNRPESWHRVLYGNPSDQPVPVAGQQTALGRLLVGRPRWLYRTVERRADYAPNPGLLRLLVRITFLLGGALVTAVTVLVTMLTGHTVDTGLTLGLLLSVLLVVLAVGYVLWGGLVDWLRQR